MERNVQKPDNTLFFRDLALSRDGTPRVYLSEWLWKRGDHWLLTGDNESGTDMLSSLAGGNRANIGIQGRMELPIPPEKTRFVSFSEAAALIEYERAHDDSDFTEGGVDPGRTAFAFIAKKAGVPFESLSNDPVVVACGVNRFGDRGIKYLSTGETRRMLLCEALLADPLLLVIEDPFDGVDTQGREAIEARLDEYTRGQGSLLLVMERPERIPRGITHALELSDGRISYSGKIGAFLEWKDRERDSERERSANEQARLAASLSPLIDRKEDDATSAAAPKDVPLVEMRKVTVEWSGRKVLDSVDWTLENGVHWLIRGPNGSGKTTFLELITGDNTQVYRNDVRLFGKRRGTGETIWEIKERLGIVSYRMHVEFRLVGDIDVESVVLSGFHDSIGLYCQKAEEETRKAKAWLELGGFSGREKERFSELSYGEQRAVLILRAVVKNPLILILDEPCHGLDDAHRRLVLNLLESIGNSRRTTLLHVTHDPSERLPCERHVLELLPGEVPMYRTLAT